MYLLINRDNSINYGNDHPIDERLDMDGLRLLEFPNKSLYEVVGDIMPYEAYWDEVNCKVIRDPRIVDNETRAERTWRNKELNRIICKLDQYERDQRIPEEYRTSKMTEKEYFNLLKYRKQLCDYPQTKSYKLKVRPQLNK